jgi:hypothetical protein
MITAILVFQQVDEGRIALDATIKTYLPPELASETPGFAAASQPATLATATMDDARLWHSDLGSIDGRPRALPFGRR